MTTPIIDSSHRDCVYIAGAEKINMTSNDYLGLSGHPVLCESVKSAIDDGGLGATGSRRLSGNHRQMVQVEQSMAHWLEKDDAVLFNSGYQMNSTLFHMMNAHNTHIIFDKRCHASLIDGILASGISWSRFRHNCMTDLQTKLDQCPPEKTPLIVVESVYSMDGDSPDIPRLVALKTQYHAQLMVDEAHAIGVMGPFGKGLLAQHQALDAADYLLITFGKAFGLMGGMVLGREEDCHRIKATNRAYIYTTALPLPIVHGIEVARQLIHEATDQRRRLNDAIQLFRSFDVPTPSSHPIQPIILGDARVCDALYEDLFHRGIYLKSIHYPTVPKHASRLRASLTSEHSLDHIRRVGLALQDTLARHRAITNHALDSR